VAWIFPPSAVKDKGTAGKAVVITHPHPLYGGTMSNPVVETIQSAYQQYGYATLRFNFRGVGGSQGNFDNGVGEKDDVRAAIAYAERMHAAKIDLAGYSFGAWVNAAVAAAKRTPIHSMVMVSPPVEFMAFENINAVELTEQPPGLASTRRVFPLDSDASIFLSC
jgi:alpha/beta superfamily hydrolase